MHNSSILALTVLVSKIVWGQSVNFEWAGIFETPGNTYMWTAQKVQSDNGVAYVDPAMKMAALPTSEATAGTLRSLEIAGNRTLQETCAEVHAGSVIKPVIDKCYLLHFKQDLWQSLYTIDTTGVPAVAFFTEHFPTEFENTAHYLKDDQGEDIEPVSELPEAQNAKPQTEQEKHWGPAITTAIIVNLITLIGVIFLMPMFAKALKMYAAEFECLVSGFAAGAISACAFFLLLFEATHLIAAEYKEEVEVIWRWGTVILAGFLFPTITQLLSEKSMKTQKVYQEKPGKQADEEQEAEVVPTKQADETLIQPQVSRVRLISGILIGDFMHNLCDGFFVGAAFQGCGESFGWKVAAGTIAHELAQELSDYAVLTGPDAQMRPGVALALNFISGTGVLLGVICILSADVADADIGLLLAFGGGIYLHIAFTECMPKLYDMKISLLVRAASTLMFMLGAMAIGFVLLDHEHCVPPTAEGEAPTGHAH
eukprot:gnl/MRDRNA2_/MRDRNA2_73939_c0_seq3.p1 gnl/MRDRNA2_/MRDRNA2_73939_c0~~gnl/MRDRNA2_/MRDRNA2_73939_c0_seq3.p1  ORF type:complete len:483 (-),score=103.97 gnl/MRDRNA2_/MRDRNA2_73939_c0_seq3:294-1742(-)